LTPEGRGFRIWFFNLGMNKTFNPKRWNGHSGNASVSGCRIAGS
jgi:hypothetical protein